MTLFMEGKMPFELMPNISYLIGRDADCHICLDDPSITRKHAIILMAPTRHIAIKCHIGKMKINGNEIGQRYTIKNQAVDILFGNVRARLFPCPKYREWMEGVDGSNAAKNAQPDLEANIYYSVND